VAELSARGFKPATVVKAYQLLGRTITAAVNAERAVPVAEGSYRWRGELRLWDNEALIGWYRSTDAAARSKGTLYLALDQHGTYAWAAGSA
jgi:phage terminase Nu1 subunit (DNA packaging protein)